MKNLRTLLVFTTLGYSWLCSPATHAQKIPAREKFVPGTYAIIHHPVTGAVQLVDLFDADRQHRWIPEHHGPHKAGPGQASVSGRASLAYDARRGQLVYAGRSLTGAAVWRHRLSNAETESIGDIPLLPGHMFTKMAAAPDGQIYALTTPVSGGSGSTDKRCRLVRITPGPKGKPAITRTVAILSGNNGFSASMMYSGDMAFSAAGDLYIFATAIDTTIQYYTGSEVFRVPGAKLRSASGAAIQVERLGAIRGMGSVPGYDSTVISGAAFLPDGRFLLSATDKATQQSALLFVGRFLPGGINAEPVTMETELLPQGFLIADLASSFFPVLPPVRKAQSSPMVRPKPDTQPEDWQQYVTLRTYQY